MQKAYWDQFVNQLEMCVNDPDNWLDSGRSWGDLEENELLHVVATTLASRRRAQTEAEFAKWCQKYGLSVESAGAKYMFERVVEPLAQLVEESPELHESIGQIEEALKHLRSTLRAVEQTQVMHNDRLQEIERLLPPR